MQNKVLFKINFDLFCIAKYLPNYLNARDFGYLFN